MNVYTLIAGITAYIAIFAGTYVYSKNTKSLINKLFFYFSLIVVFYVFADYNYLITDNLNLAKIWFRLSMMWPFIFSIQLHLLLIFSNKKIRKSWYYLMYGIPLIITYLLMVVIDLDVRWENQQWISISFDKKSIINIVQLLFATSSTLFITITGISFLLKNKDKKRTQTVLLLIGIILPSVYGAIKESFPGVDLMNSLPTSTVAFVGWGFFLIAIWQYQLFNITPEYAAERILSTMKESLLLINEDGIVVTANNEFIEVFELEKSSIIGKPFNDFLKMCEFPDQPIIEKYQKQEFKNVQFNFTTQSAKRLYLNYTNSFIRDGRNNILGNICIITDISEIIAFQEQLNIQHRQMLDLAHQAGMAEIATNVVHNIGNVLNSVNISSEKVSEILNTTKLDGFIEATQLLTEHQDNLYEFFTNDYRGKVLINYYIELSKILKQENDQMKEESKIMHEKIELIKTAISIQQNYAHSQDLSEPIELSMLLDESIKIMSPICKKNRIKIEISILINQNFTVIAPRIKLLNIIINLLKNAIEAIISAKKESDRYIKIVVEGNNGNTEIKIRDNGIGISEENMKHIFEYGFSTKTDGHGFGLHFCANAVKEMGWKLKAQNNSPESGAEFIITI